jgi:hypothetical protein
MHVRSPSARTHAAAAAALVHGPRLQSTADRQAELLHTKHFTCMCTRCTSPPESDAWLNGHCCGVCGAKGVITDAAQQLQQEADLLAELLLDTTTTGNTTNGSSKREGKQSTKQSAALAVQSDNNGATAGAGASEEQQLQCSSCRQPYTAAQVQAALKKATTARTQWSVTRQHCSPADALKQLQHWFEEHDAGSMAAATTGTASATAAKKQGSVSSKSSTAAAAVKLHPCHSTVLGALVQLANACNAAQQYAGAAKAFKRVVTAMEAVYPEHFPELSGLYESWYTAVRMVLTARTAALPKRLREGYVADARYAAQKCYAVRLVALGEDHASTAAAAAAVEQCTAL